MIKFIYRRVVRQSRRMARSTYAAPPPGFQPINTPQPIRRGPKTPGKKLRVRFEGDTSTPQSTNAPNTPAFVFNTPKDKKMHMSKKDEFQMNVNKEKFNTWMKVLHSSQWRRSDVRSGLTKFELPTKLINDLYEKRAEDPEPWKALVASHSHNGFLTRSGLVIPKVDVTKIKPRDWELESEEEGKVSSESLMQQKDGKCKICRGFKWAGIVLTREISEGEEVPCYSQHKSVKPYTPQELEEFKKRNHDSLFRRWCQESRWDWLFEDPPLSGLDKDGNDWVIPGDDPRLRHITRLNEVGKCYDADRLDLYMGMKNEFSKQDLAAKRFIDAIEKSGNLTVAHQLKQMDMERKRRQVEVKFLCVRQVRIVVKGKESVRAKAGKRPASAADLHTESHKRPRPTVEDVDDEDAPPKPVARKIANPRSRRPLVKTNGNGKQTTATIIPPTVLEPLQRIPAPFDPVELKKIRLAPPTDDTYKAPETIFRERFEEATRFSPKPTRSTGTYSAREEDFSPPSKEELEAEIYFENCKKVEAKRIEEEKLRAKEIEEERARARGEPEAPVNRVSGKPHYPVPLSNNDWSPPKFARPFYSHRQMEQKSNWSISGGQPLPIRGERDRGNHINVGVRKVVGSGAGLGLGLGLGAGAGAGVGVGEGGSIYVTQKNKLNKAKLERAFQTNLNEQWARYRAEIRELEGVLRVDPFWKRPEDPGDPKALREDQERRDQVQLRLDQAARLEAMRADRDRRAAAADVAAAERQAAAAARKAAALVLAPPPLPSLPPPPPVVPLLVVPPVAAAPVSVPAAPPAPAAPSAPAVPVTASVVLSVAPVVAPAVAAVAAVVPSVVPAVASAAVPALAVVAVAVSAPALAPAPAPPVSPAGAALVVSAPVPAAGASVPPAAVVAAVVLAPSPAPVVCAPAAAVAAAAPPVASATIIPPAAPVVPPATTITTITTTTTTTADSGKEEEAEAEEKEEKKKRLKEQRGRNQQAWDLMASQLADEFLAEKAEGAGEVKKVAEKEVEVVRAGRAWEEWREKVEEDGDEDEEEVDRVGWVGGIDDRPRVAEKEEEKEEDKIL